MMFSWFTSSPSKPVTSADNQEEDKNETDDDPQKTKKRVSINVANPRPKRISKSWIDPRHYDDDENNLEGKIAHHNLLDVEESIDQFRASSSLVSPSRSKRFEAFLDSHRISSRPLYVVRQSDSDVLRFKEDEFEKTKRENKGKFISIPILPADEMNSLTSEVKLWHRSRKKFKVVFTIAMVCGSVIFLISTLFSIFWYSNSESHFLNKIWPSLEWRQVGRLGSNHFNIHMNAQIVDFILMAVGVNMFRLFPQTKLTKVIFYHAIGLIVSFLVSAIGSYWAIKFHQEFTDMKLHFNSIHSWISILAYIFYIYCFFTGFLLLYDPCNEAKESHSRFAIVAFMLIGASCIVGFFDRACYQMIEFYSYRISVSGIMVNIFGVLIVIYCIFVRLAAASFDYRRRPKPQWDVIVYRSLEPMEDIYLEIHDMYDSFELWMKQVNQARLKALRVAHSSYHSSLASDKSATKSDDTNPSVHFRY